jgi:tRNA pseudouridine38-40 synthase
VLSVVHKDFPPARWIVPREAGTFAGPMPVQRYKLTIAYRGTAYHGWQHQSASNTWKGEIPAPGRGIPTIQELLRRALESVVRHPVNLVGSSRTDARVHAKGQVAHFDTDQVQIPPEGLRRAVNHALPEDILLHAIEPVPSSFSAVLSTESKRYQYQIWNAPDRPVFFADLAWHRWQTLNPAAMARAAALLQGTHDFCSFARPGHGRATTIRTIHACTVRARGSRIVIGVEGDGFLWNMVRILAGTWVEVGMGRRPAESMPQILAARDRRAAGGTAPPHGLYLQWIRFRDRGEAF